MLNIVKPDKYQQKNNLFINFNNTNNINNISDSEILKEMRLAGECHKKVRIDLYNYIKPGLKIYDICNFIENTVKKYSENSNKQLNNGIGFPVGFSINNVIAHDTASPFDNRILKYNDVVKIDYGTHYNGRIIDSAFTLAYNPIYQNLLDATKDATWSAIKNIGADTLVNEISSIIDEVITSYEIELNNKTYKINSVGELGGHNIKQYIIHGGKLVLCKPNNHELIKNMRFNTNECYAIETFASTGTGIYKENNLNNNLYSLNFNNFSDNLNNLKFESSKKLFQSLRKKYSTLPFCSRWIADDYDKIPFKELIKNKLIIEYPPLYDINNSYTSQLEHTIYLHENGKEILSNYDDY